MEASDWNETSELKYLTHWMPLPSPPDDVAAPAEQQTQPGAVYAELPEPNFGPGRYLGKAIGDAYAKDQMRDFADRTHALRVAAAPQAAPGERELAGVSQDDVTNPLHPRYIAGYKAGHEAGRKRAAPQQEPCGWAADRVRIEKTEKNGWCAHLDVQDAEGNHIGTVNLCRGIGTEDAARALVQNWMREFVPEPKQKAQEPFGWIKSSEVESSNSFGGSINLWREKYDCDTPIFTEPQPAPAAQEDALDAEVLRDAERYRFIRDVPYSDDVRSVLVHQQNAAMDRVIDAARAAQKGFNHDN